MVEEDKSGDIGGLRRRGECRIFEEKKRAEGFVVTLKGSAREARRVVAIQAHLEEP